MIFVGIDDTDVIGSRGTNQLAREIARRAADRWTCRRIVRHQLLHDPRIPFTSKNGSASIAFEPRVGTSPEELCELCRNVMREWFIAGSDPGLCVAASVPDAVQDFGQLCQREIVTQEAARQLAGDLGLYLDGLGGTNGGVIGALAAVGLAVTENDGRIIQWETWPDDLSGWQPIESLISRGVMVREFDGHGDLDQGQVDVGKHLRPNLRGGKAVLFVRLELSSPNGEIYSALKLP